jgi:thiol-disulfide isomerase/thioredoxin
MKNLMFGALLALSSHLGFAAQINLNDLKLPWKNASVPNAVFDLSEKPNQVYVFEVFSIGCHWCNENAPQVQELAKDFATIKNVQFMDLGLDTRELDYTRWIKTHAPSYPVVQDIGKKVYKALSQENAIPQTFVVDCKGQLVGSTVGFWHEEEKETIKNSIEKAQQTVCE